MADELIEALRRGKLPAVRAAIKVDPEKARHARAVVEAGRLAFREAFALLQKNGADLNAIWRGYRPLHALLQEDPHAAAGKPTSERLACLDWLLQHGADLKAKTKSWNHDVDAMYFAASSKNKALFELFLDRGGDPTEALVHALWSPGEEFAELALAHGAEPDRAVAEGKPLLNHLIQWGQIKPALWLLARGASPNIADSKQGWTAAHQAASRGNARMMHAVLDAGADLARRDKQGHTPPAIAKLTGRAKLMEMINTFTG
ncbi:MAG TPA: ankyrin repeat domain-containing protein [Bryobacteraceae bacterium]|nr:ankyrin repeat domain-containing protein [Bryobacteraceae bacterium]